MLSTMDGTLSAFDARTGTTLFTHRDSRPAADSWAAPGVPDYIPSLDGLLYRIDRNTNEAHVIHGKFISGLSDATLPFSAPDHADAIILTEEQSSVMLIDLRTGRLLANLKYSDTAPEPAIPGLTEHVIAVSRTSVGVRVVEVESRREIANASLIHNVPSFIASRRCLPLDDVNPDAFVAYMTDSREKLFVKSLQTGEILWSKDVESSVVEAHGLGGVRIVANRRQAELVGGTQNALPDESDAIDVSDAGSDLYVAREGKSVYAMLATPSESEDKENSSRENEVLESEPKRKKIRRYHVANVRDPTALHSIDRPFGLGSLGLRRDSPRSTKYKYDNNNANIIGSKDAGLVLAALVVVGLFGYIVGSRPRHERSLSRRKVKRRRRTNADIDPTADDQDAPIVDAHDEDDETDSGLEDNAVVTGIMARGVGSTDRSGNSSNDAKFDTPNENHGVATTAAAYPANDTEITWSTVGCLQVSTKVLGTGSHGTTVYEGRIIPGERKVAVKRLLRQFYESAKTEISLLVELDEASPHVVRYFAMEENKEFIFLALELCAGSLAERVASKLPPVPPSMYISGPPPAETSRALRQLVQGLADLHRAGVVHRDVKPQNVLITRSAASCGDVKLADVGLALRLADNRSSYTAITNNVGGVGTTGWRAPEVLNGERLTKAVDVFAAGCVVSFVLTGGHHPFGDEPYRRDGNIVTGRPTLASLEALNLPEAVDIVKKMVDPVASNRPSAEEAVRHPFFWTDAMKLSFLVDISDRLYDLRNEIVRYTENLDVYPLAREHCSDWLVRMDMDLLKGLGRQYENTASGLLRVIRNKRNHYSELSSALQKRLGSLPEDKDHAGNGNDRSHRSSTHGNDCSDEGSNFLTYFTSRVPHLLMCVYQYAIENPALIDQPHFYRYGLKVARRMDRMSMHPLARRVRQASSEGRVVPTGADPATVAGARQSDPVHREQDVRNMDSKLETNDRRTYYRHELVWIQAMRPETSPELRRRMIQCEVYQPSAYARYKKRLESNEFDSSDFDDLPPLPKEADTEELGVPPGFQRVMPRRQSPHVGMTGQRTSMYAGSPGSLRPNGFAGQRFGGIYGAWNGNGNPAGHQGEPHNRRNHVGDASPAPTVSQWSGEERVVDFGALRKQTR